jgi:hypothetical protein
VAAWTSRSSSQQGSRQKDQSTYLTYLKPYHFYTGLSEKSCKQESFTSARARHTTLTTTGTPRRIRAEPDSSITLKCPPKLGKSDMASTPSATQYFTPKGKEGKMEPKDKYQQPPQGTLPQGMPRRTTNKKPREGGTPLQIQQAKANGEMQNTTADGTIEILSGRR